MGWLIYHRKLKHNFDSVVANHQLMLRKHLSGEIRFPPKIDGKGWREENCSGKEDVL
jgi:hypothetical protein